MLKRKEARVNVLSADVDAGTEDLTFGNKCKELCTMYTSTELGEIYLPGGYDEEGCDSLVCSWFGRAPWFQCVR